MVTGRHSKLAPLVEDIFKELNLEFDERYYKGDHVLTQSPLYPAANDTPSYKMFTIKEFLLKRSEYTHLEIWEDRDDVVALFKDELVPQIKERYPQMQYICIHDVKEKRDYHYPIYACNLHASIKLKGGGT